MDESAFDFEEERLAQVFSQLSPKRQEVLALLYVQGLKPHDIASKWESTPDYVYKLRYRAILELRRALQKGDER